jgi:hypothetical protein
MSQEASQVPPERQGDSEEPTAIRETSAFDASARSGQDAEFYELGCGLLLLFSGNMSSYQDSEITNLSENCHEHA